MKPQTVVRWHRAGFRAYWRWKSRARKAGRPRIDAELRALIRRLALDNPTWGAPRVHGELRKLGFDVAERTVSRYMPKRPPGRDTIRRWVTFMRNHRDVIVGMDFFVVPTVTFDLLFVFVIIEHARRRILHFNVGDEPGAEWIIQQLREAFPWETAPRYAILDRDGKYGEIVPQALESMGVMPIRIGRGKPWQNGICERWIGSCRRELLDHVIVLNAAHLHRLLRSYVDYYHADRPHLSLYKDAPTKRPVTPKPSPDAKVVALPRVGGIHHRYDWRDAA